MAALDSLTYQTGFGNELSSEAVPGALPVGQNNPQRAPLGLFTELVSGTTFSAPRSVNRRTWAYRIRPSVQHGKFRQIDRGNFLTPPFEAYVTPNQLRWDPFAMPDEQLDFVEGMTTICSGGSPAAQSGMSVHIYRATKSMSRRFFLNGDGEFLVLPELGRVLLATEFGSLLVEPGELALIPRGVKFRVELPDERARGYLCENFGRPYQLPELGVIGSSGLANRADFQVPDARYEVVDEPCTLVHKIAGHLWEAELSHSPLDVVAWRGNLVPAKFDMSRFVAMGTVTVDHPDPSIFTALTSPGDSVLGGNSDFMVIPPRWSVAEHTFRPPAFHRNCVAEYLGIIWGKRESNADGMSPGGATLHNSWVAHGPDVQSFESASSAELLPKKIDDGLVFMFESRLPLGVTPAALAADELQSDYQDHWQGFTPGFAS